MSARTLFFMQKIFFADYRSAKIVKKNLRKNCSHDLLNLVIVSSDGDNLHFATDYLINEANKSKQLTELEQVLDLAYRCGII